MNAVCENAGEYRTRGRALRRPRRRRGLRGAGSRPSPSSACREQALAVRPAAGGLKPVEYKKYNK